MPFTEQEKIQLAAQISLQLFPTGLASPGKEQWYSTLFAYVPIIPPNKIWNEFSTIPPANTPAQAYNNALLNPTILSRTTTRLTLLMTSNYRAWAAKVTYGDEASANYENFILPSVIRTATNEPSNGYIVRLWHGIPNLSGSTEILTSFQAVDDETSWFFNYQLGILLVSSDVSNYFKTFHNTNGIYVDAIRYIGSTGGSGGICEAKLVTCQIELTHPPDPNYPSNQFALVVTDDDGNVLNEV